MKVVDVADDSQGGQSQDEIGVGHSLSERVEEYSKVENHPATQKDSLVVGAAPVGTVDDVKFLCHKEIEKFEYNDGGGCDDVIHGETTLQKTMQRYGKKLKWKNIFSRESVYVGKNMYICNLKFSRNNTLNH